MRSTRKVIRVFCGVLAMGVAQPSRASAQTVAGCYVPAVGAFYVIKRTGLPTACLSTTHVELTLVGPTSLGWGLTGNAGTNVTTNFMGTTDAQPLQLRVNSVPVMHLSRVTYQGRATPVPAVGIGTTAPTVPLEIDLEEGSFRVHPFFAAVSGTTLVGAWSGKTNEPQVRYDGPAPGFADVGLNGTGDYVIEESDNPRIVVQRSGNGGSTLISDANGGPMTATAAGQFAVRASGGVRLRSSANLSTGCDLAAGSGTWACTSSRAAKSAVEPVSAEAVLAGIARIPIRRWSYVGPDSSTRHVGPFAEDFYQAFGVGAGPTTISGVDADGVSLLGIQALEKKTRVLEQENAALRARLTRLEAVIGQLSARHNR